MASEPKLNVVGVFMDQLGLEQEDVSFRDAKPYIPTPPFKKEARVFS